MYTKRNFFSQISFFSFLIACLFLILPSLLIAAALTSELPTLQSFPGQASTQPAGTVAQISATALWDQPLSTVNATAYVDQEFSGLSQYTSFLVDDFTNRLPWNITAISSPGDGWNGFSTLMNATALNWYIYADNGSGLPDGYPSGPGNTPFWSISLPPTDLQVTITNGSMGYPSNARIDLATPVNLPPGTWWLFFYPTIAFGTGGQYGRQVADTTNGAQAQIINPGGGFGIGTEWAPISIIGPSQQDLAFTIEGTELLAGTVGTQFTFAGSDFGDKKGKFLIENTATSIAKGGWTPTNIACIVKKPLPAGVYNITVVPNKASAIPFPSAFAMSNPVINSLSSTDGFVGEEVIISGWFFSTKKGKVYLEYDKDGQTKKKNCPVKSWTMDPITGVSQIVFVVPKGLEPRKYPLTVINKVGSALTAFEIK